MTIFPIHALKKYIDQFVYDNNLPFKDINGTEGKAILLNDSSVIVNVTNSAFGLCLVSSDILTCHALAFCFLHS